MMIQIQWVNLNFIIFVISWVCTVNLLDKVYLYQVIKKSN